MRIGCGLTTKRIRGRPYLYFWHYEDRGGRRVPVQQYLGPPGSAAARGRLVAAVDLYFGRLEEELRRKREETLARLGPG